MTFEKRQLGGPATLGERFRQLRTEHRLSLQDISRSIEVPEKYLAAIEGGQYQDLPGLVYGRSFVRKYAACLNVPEQAALERFEEEYAIVHGRRKESPRLVPRANTEFPWYIKHTRFIIAAVVLIGVGAYLVAQVVHLVQPPILEITAPATDVSIREPSILVVGKTEPEAVLKINNQLSEVQTDGTFTESVELQPGLNTLKITAVRKYSQTAEVIRQVFLERENP